MNLQQYNISANNFEQCIKCTVCTVYCPVVPVNSNYPGPKHAGPDGERFRLKDPDFYDNSLKYCLNCKRCEVACPSGVRIGDIIQSARIKYSTSKPKLRDMMLANTDIVGSLSTPLAPVVNMTLGLKPVKLISARIKYSTSKPKLRDMMLANTDIVGSLSTPLAPVVNMTLGLKPVKLIMDSVLKIDHRRMFPKYASQTFESWYHKNAEEKQKTYSKHVSYFHGCYANYNYPKLGQDLVKIMNAAGYGVHLLAKEKCCGVALISNGLIKQATRQGEHNIKSIRQSVVENKMPVIGTSSTCMFTLRDEYPHLLHIDNKDVRDDMELATRFLFRLIDKGELKLVFRKDYKKRIAYHTACHMEKLGWAIYSTSLLRMIPGVEFIMLDSQCCGIAGTYGFKKENYETSQGIGASLFKKIEDLHPDYVATDCETCKWQIEMSTSAKVMNPISILAEALDVEATIALNNNKY